MRCKLGDLAIIVRCKSNPDSIGSIVRCIEFRPCPDTGIPAWKIDRSIGCVRFYGGSLRCADWYADECLQPIRDQNGEDEMLRITGKPESKKEKLKA